MFFDFFFFFLMDKNFKLFSNFFSNFFPVGNSFSQHKKFPQPNLPFFKPADFICLSCRLVFDSHLLRNNCQKVLEKQSNSFLSSLSLSLSLFLCPYLLNVFSGSQVFSLTTHFILSIAFSLLFSPFFLFFYYLAHSSQ